MDSSSQSSRRIILLREEVSRKIAAGEVIERPFSVLRELLDNSIDAGSSRIDVTVEGGGESRLRVVDDGAGMTPEDLELCWQRHATSKIREEADLYRVHTLGFRGEALAAIAACSRLSIVSRLREEREEGAKPSGGLPAAAGGAAGAAHRLVVEGGRKLLSEPCQGAPGTAVDVAELFFNLPARRRFLKSPAAESALCRQVFLEKALPHPGIAFRYSAGGGLKHFFPAQELADRVRGALALDRNLAYPLEKEAAGLCLQAVAGRPELTRRDRKMIQLFVNRRRIFEYGLVQAVQYAYSEYVPGGQFPVAFLFLEIDPGEVDFNIHPAKREARFRDLPALRRLVVAALQEFLKAFDLRPGPGGWPSPPGEPGRPGYRPAQAGEPGRPGGRAAPPPAGPGRPAEPALPFEEAPSAGPAGPLARASAGPVGTPSPPPVASSAGPPGRPAAPADIGPRYRGQLFRLFLLVEHAGRLFIVDQHAAHERILYEELQRRPPVSQELLMPLRLELSREERVRLEERTAVLERLGIRLEEGEDGALEVVALPEELLAIEEEELAAALTAEQGSPEELEQRVLSLAACRLAVKDGQELDAVTAADLVRRAFALHNARCPHGRPIWTEISREELERRVGRG